MAKVGHSGEAEEVVQAIEVELVGPFGVGNQVDNFLGWPQADLAVVLVLFSWLLQQFGPIGFQFLRWTIVGPE